MKAKVIVIPENRKINSNQKLLYKNKNLISIIVIVKNDRGIDNTLSSLAKIKTVGKTETIVVDASKGKLDDIKKKYPLARWVYFYSKTNKKITIPEQRNVGIRKAKGNIIAFIDANCIPTNRWLVELTKPIMEKTENIVSGLINPIGKKSVHDIVWDSRMNVTYLKECGAANLAFNKDVLKNVGIFDENFGIGEDTDFTWRAVDKGYKIRYNKNAVIYHDWGNLKDEIKRAFVYGIARAKLYKKYPNRWRNLIGYDFITLAYPIYILLLPVTLFWHYYPLLILIPALKNVKRNPIKVVFLNLINGFGVLYSFIF